jgi:hypothetical protein
MTTAFTGTAAYYAVSSAVSEQFLVDLRSRANTTGRGCCSTLRAGWVGSHSDAPYFDSVLAVDVEPEMIAF